MAKRESIVPGLGKKQAAVFENREARQLEHKRHLDELGFPQEQDKHGRPELEAASLRYAPVSYDDPENPTPSRVVNQAGQDLADSNETPNKMVLNKEDLLDVSAIVKEAMDEVFIQKDKGPIGFVKPETKASGLKGLFRGAGKLLPWAAPLLFNPVSKVALGIVSKPVLIGAGIGYAAWKGWDAIEEAFESDSERAATVEKISKVPYNLRTDSQQRDLKEALDELWGKKFGLGSTGGEYIDGQTNFATPADMTAYFNTLYDGQGNIPIVQIDEFTEQFAAPDNAARRAEMGIVGKVFESVGEDAAKLMGALFGTDTGDTISFEDFNTSMQNAAKNDALLVDDKATTKNILQGMIDIEELPKDSNIIDKVKNNVGQFTENLKQNIPGIGLDIEIGSNLKTDDLVDMDVPVLDMQGMGTAGAAVGLDASQQAAATKTALEKPKQLRDIQSQIGSAMAGTGQTPTAQQEARTKFESPTLQIAADKRAKEMEKPITPPPPTPTPPAGSRNTQADLQSTAAMTPPTLKPSGTAALGSTSKGRTLSVDEGLIDGKQFGTISGPGTADYRIQVNSKTYPKAKPGEVITLSKMDTYQAWIEKAEGEGAMAKVQLDRVSDLAAMMHDILEDGDELPGWIQNKISDSLHNLEASISHVMYDEKEEQGLVKSKQVFHDFLAKAPQTRGNLLENEVFLQKFLGLGLLGKLAPKVAKFLTGGLLFGGAAKKGSKIVGEKVKEETKKKGVNKTLLGLGALSTAGVAGVLGYQPPSLERDEALKEYNSLPETLKRGIDNQIKPKAQEALDMLPDPVKEVGSNAFDAIAGVVDNIKRGGEFKGLTAEQVQDIGASDRGADYSSPADPNIVRRGTELDINFKPASYIMPIYDTSPEANARVRAGGSESIIGYSSPAGDVMLNKPVSSMGQLPTQLSKQDPPKTGGNFAGALAGLQSQTSTDKPYTPPAPSGGPSKLSTGAGSDYASIYGKDFADRGVGDSPYKGGTDAAEIAADPAKYYGNIAGYADGKPITFDEATAEASKAKAGTEGVPMEDTFELPKPPNPEDAVPDPVQFDTLEEAQRTLFPDSFENAIVKEAVSEFLSKAKKKGGRKKDPRLERAGVEGYNKPKRTPKHPKKSHIVVAKEGNKIKTIRYGEQGAKTAGDPKKGESAKMKKKRKSFKARHAKNIKRGKMSAAYWADKSKW